MARNTRVSVRVGAATLEAKREQSFDPGPVLGEGFPDKARAEPSDPLYPVALLKIAMAMKRLPPDQELHFEQILDEVLRDLLLDTQDFRTYLDRNKGRLMAAVRSRGY